jgi:MFS family permease
LTWNGPVETAGVGREDIEDALLEGDRALEAGTARAALRHVVFRRVYLGALLSNIGSWMQNVILGAFVYHETGSATYVSLATLAQLGPLLLFSLIGGAIADRYSRRLVLVVVSVEQLLFSLVIAWITAAQGTSIWLLLGAVLAIGIGQAIYAPAYAALMPSLVPPADLAGAVSLNSVNMNLSRVVGPAIGGFLYAAFGAPWVFVGNAVTYVFIIGALHGVEIPRPTATIVGSRWRSTIEGFGVARRDHVIGRCLTTMVYFSFFSLPVAVLRPVVARENLGVDERSAAYGLLYACFGAGAVVGALSIGTFLAHQDLAKVVRFGLAGFAITLAAFALLRAPEPAYLIAFLVGFCYFATVTSLATVLQQRLDEAVRGRVMALWVMAFGGTVPLGGMLAGRISDAANITVVLIGGAAVAALLVPYARLRIDGGVSRPGVR